MAFALLPPSLWGQPKPLDHDVYNLWRSLQAVQMHPEGQWLHYEINPAKGDGFLYLRDRQAARVDSFARGEEAQLAADASFFAFRLAPHYDSLRQRRIPNYDAGDKEKPEDTLAVWLTGPRELVKIPVFQSFEVAEEGGNWLAYRYKSQPAEPAADSAATDTAAIDSLPADTTTTDSLEESADELPESVLTLWRPATQDTLEIPDVESYRFSEEGRYLVMHHALGDSIDSVCVQLFTTETTQLDTLYFGPGKMGEIALFEPGNGYRLAYLMTQDTGEVKRYDLYLAENGRIQRRIDSLTGGLPAGLTPHPDENLYFSDSGERLFLHLRPTPEPSVEDSVPSDERPGVDVWSWQDSRLQPEQLRTRNDDRNPAYLSVYHLDDLRLVQLENDTLRRVRPQLKGDGRYALGIDALRHALRMSWEAPRYRDYYVLDVETGEKVYQVEEKQYPVTLSPDGQYLLYWDKQGRAWRSIDWRKRQDRNLTGSLSVNFFREEHDSPSEPYPYGLEGWTADGRYVVLNDRYDLWRVDLSGEENPVNLTQGHGRANGIRYSYEKLDDEAEYLPEDSWTLSGTHESDRSEGYYRLKRPLRGGTPEELIHSDHGYSRLNKADDAAVLTFRRQNFREYPELWITDLAFDNPEKLTETNPQQKDYRWGTVELVSWEAFDGQELDGLMYKPDDFDPSKKYPMLIYFYEKTSDRLHRYSTPAPSRSIIYPSWYVSNGYLVFMPDITYKTGQPGPDAYNAVVSGAEAMVDRYDWIDAANIGIQGQSWGGYQVAYLVTQTDMFKAAMAGAPVSNMTSAYGGIRWGSGLSRMFQYEETQSRLGATLWEDRSRYIENSPLFFADRVETPLLMMHNDDDGAVPWYQGIEYFVALRRLRKPAWLLVYNGEPHNLRGWANRIDLSIRMSQFFDHYLKDAPAPKWMTQGVPAVDKGEDYGYEVEE